MGLYVEAYIRADLEALWSHTQDPAVRGRWDVRITRIDHLPSAEDEPQRFRYATRVAPFLTLTGTGVLAGEKERPDGTRASALRFTSPHPLSLIAEGSGYWRYIPDGEGVRFLTGCDYRARWGVLGALVDRMVLRPLMVWATAWSFDRLRLWLERGIAPERSRRNWWAELVLRAMALAAAGAAFAYGRALPLTGPLAPLCFFAVPPLALVAVASALFAPPLPGTPSARRCLRRPPTRVCAPRVLRTLEFPA